MATTSTKTPIGLAASYVIFLVGLSAVLGSQSLAATFDTPYVTRAEAAMVLLLARVPSLPPIKNEGRFIDIKSGEWYESYMVYAERYGLIKPDPLGRLRPHQAINRAEFLKMLSYTFGLPENLPHKYSDVSDRHWFAPFAGIAYEFRLFPRNETFPRLAPGNPLTHKEVTLALKKLFETRGHNFPPLDVLADARHASAQKLKLYLVISILEEEVRIIQPKYREFIERPLPPIQPMKPELSFEDVLDSMRMGELRTEMLTVINQKRAAQGLPPFRMSITLQGSAQKYAEVMSKENVFGHVGPAGETFRERIEASGYYDPFLQTQCHNGDCERTFVLGENLARGQKTVQEAVKAWMESPAHKKAILHPNFMDLGIGISAGYWVQHFGGLKIK